MAFDAKKMLQSGLAKLSINATAEQQDQLLNYLALLQKWNKAYNLTAIRDPEQMLVKHILDSVAIQPYVAATDLIDVGSGAGLPGIPMAILNPELPVTTLDSNGKKTRFQHQVKIELGLANLEVVHGRVEEFADRKFTQVTSRAFASIEDMVTLSSSLLADDGIFLAMKGRYPDSELESLPAEYQLLETYSLNVPGLDEERHLLKIGRA
ncbi:16S rRNA (guanine(527)-N(7))-methyltransferase RsmG [Marinobacterium sp. LSUCC0821]|jgi:16S rRNA (guanine527-N7)-methyltransferase|uniref:16S rRNA (guanine(527)-N(7))-methyltransferase RsmG n=1 Tax=Marinobacterium sp. LSUCC0821 TaxID=2668067 RepID=UPI00145124D5|nr:16S rRNA (guanine(527)-N(7))-methyltransferase RsmG [Marinobacterium sp. LSUCC0821]QJD71863.1 16S rRNA (guanine(527)-N(7))-methyltransferase RsmG [Marinobacterium sp. LSUCC0821]